MRTSHSLRTGADMPEGRAEAVPVGVKNQPRPYQGAPCLPPYFHVPSSKAGRSPWTVLSMRYLDVSLDNPADNLALDQALLDEAERAEAVVETLRVWESPQWAVVLGHSSVASQEVRLGFCRAQAIPVLRRTSGGAAVMIGPGCLMYSLVLSLAGQPPLQVVRRAHHAVLGRLAAALRQLVPEVQCRGTSDLACGDLKFSGNSLRARRKALLYHGTILYRFRLDLIEECLLPPRRQPEYRRSRPHRQFLMNLPVPADTLRQVLCWAWQGPSGESMLAACCRKGGQNVSPTAGYSFGG